MITAYDKAKELVDKFYETMSLAIAGAKTIQYPMAKKAAAMCVEEILEAIRVFNNGPDWQLEQTVSYQYWQIVLKQINIL